MRRISLAAVGFALLASQPAGAEPLNAQQARAFVVGRLFSFNCFEGTSGAGRVFADGSVAGTIALGERPTRFVRLPPNTLRVRGAAVCGFVKGMTFEPCFDLERTGPTSFRGTLAGFQTMWCDFISSERPRVASRRHKRPSEEASAE